MATHLIKFSVNNWNHLYSLEQAILSNEQATGKSLSITGTIRNQPILNHKDTPIHISFSQIDGTPKYTNSDDGQIILGEIKRFDDKLVCPLDISEKVFNELRKNLMEYADIDGIHIVITIGFISQQQDWPVNTKYPVVKLDYAMKGDA